MSAVRKDGGCPHGHPQGLSGCPECQDAITLGKAAVESVPGMSELLSAAAHDGRGKPSFNPKDSVGVKKVPVSTWPLEVFLEVGLALLEGARKYGRHNYLVIPVMASTYVDAVMARHLPAFWGGEDIDPDSGLHHVTKAIASLVVLRAAIIYGTFMDDRPPRAPAGFIANLNAKAAAIIEKYPDGVAAFTEISHGEQARKAAEDMKR